MAEENTEGSNENIVDNSSEPANEKKPGKENLRVLENIDVALTVEVGGAEIKIKELLRLGEGSVVELDRLAGDPLDILANGTMIAKGEANVGERYGVRFTEIVDPEKNGKHNLVFLTYYNKKIMMTIKYPFFSYIKLN